MELFTCRQISEIDKLTMQLEPIESIDLMERASLAAADWIMENIGNNHPVYIFTGPGNNGGDALVIARSLAWCHFDCRVFVTLGHGLKSDPAYNLNRLVNQNKVQIYEITSEDQIPEIPANVIVIDGLFGSGLNKPISGLSKQLVQRINQSGAKVISIDIPSGLFGEDNTENDLSAIIKATYTLTFQFPKISFLFPENEQFTGLWQVIPIGLHPQAIEQTESDYFFLSKEYFSEKIKPRGKFSHKGTYGHALLIAGSYGKMGAAVLASKACLRSGVGLLTTHIPQRGYEIMQTAIPEAMISIDVSETIFSDISELNSYSAIGTGPGLGKKPETQQALKKILQAKPQKLVIDADGLNILSENQEWYNLFPENTILTPHPKEFERLAGPSANSFERLQKQLKFSEKYKVIVICKGAHTCITLPDGRVFFNNTGNPGMAAAGSGDVLTGIILGLLAQDYTPEEAALIGVFLHGVAGDLAAKQFGQDALIAGDIIGHLGPAFMAMK